MTTHASTSPPLPANRFDRLGFLAIWNGLYMTALVGVAAALLAQPLTLAAGLVAFLLTVSVYLMDRVKPADRFVDPADAKAHPTRFAFMRAHAGAIRVAMVLAALGAGAAAWFVHPIAPLGVVLAHAGVLIYGSLPRRPRPKDVFIVKNLTVAAGVTCMVLPLAAHVEFLAAHVGAATIVGLFVLLHVTADAMLCDVDDREADAAHGTHTAPNRLGVRATWLLATGLGVLAWVVLVSAGMAELIPIRAAWTYGGLLVASTVVVRIAAPARVRDWVDLKLPLAAAVAWGLLRLLG